MKGREVTFTKHFTDTASAHIFGLKGHFILCTFVLNVLHNLVSMRHSHVDAFTPNSKTSVFHYHILVGKISKYKNFLGAIVPSVTSDAGARAGDDFFTRGT